MRRRAFLLGIVLIAACGGDKASTTDPNGTGGQVGTATNGTFTATINGVNWGAQGTVVVQRSTGNFIGMAGSGSINSTTAYSLVVAIANATGPGTHSLTISGGDGSSLIVGASNGAGWGTGFNGGSGTVTLTTVTSNHIVGTFTADATPATTGATGTLQVRNGKFDITF